MRDHPRQSVSQYVLDLFPELASLKEKEERPPIPIKAPILWSDTRTETRRPTETPPDFIKRVYAPWVGKGLTRADIHRLDFKLYNALNYWLTRNEPPPDFDLPTLKQSNDRWVDEVARGRQLLPIDSKGAVNLAGAMRRREK